MGLFLKDTPLSAKEPVIDPCNEHLATMQGQIWLTTTEGDRDEQPSVYGLGVSDPFVLGRRLLPGFWRFRRPPRLRLPRSARQRKRSERGSLFKTRRKEGREARRRLFFSFFRGGCQLLKLSPSFDRPGSQDQGGIDRLEGSIDTLSALKISIKRYAGYDAKFRRTRKERGD